MIPKPAPGDVLLSSSRTCSSRAIQTLTLSRFSHAAIVLDESGGLLEAVPRKKEKSKKSVSGTESFGVRPQTFDKFMADNGSVWLLRRRQELNREDAARLKQVALEYVGHEYDALSAGASGATRIGQVWLLGVLAYFGWALYNGGLDKPQLVALAPAFIVPALLLKVAGNRSWADALARTLRVPSRLMNDPKGQFCSRLVCDVYERMGQPLPTYGKEPRPKDLRKALRETHGEPNRLKPAEKKR